jgi:hypothetical protein
LYEIIAMDNNKKNVIKEFVRDILFTATMFTAIYAGVCGMYPTKNLGNSAIVSTDPCQSDQSYNFISNNKDKIKKYAKEYNVPVMLIAATIINENECRPRYEDWCDELGKGLNLNVSYGMAQIKLDTARELYKKYFGESITRERAASLLTNTDESIKLIALFYKNEIEHMGIKDPERIEQDPYILARLFSIYVGGRKYSSEDAEIAGYNALLHTADPRLSKALNIDYQESNRDKIMQFINKNRDKLSRSLNEKNRLHRIFL